MPITGSKTTMRAGGRPMSLKSPACAVALSFVPAAAPLAQAMPMVGTRTGHVDQRSPRVLGGPGYVQLDRAASGLNAGPGTPVDGAGSAGRRWLS